jgi:hypothetical protein
LLVDDPELRKLGTELNQRLLGILEQKRVAADKLLFWRQQASTSAATIAGNLGALTEVSRQRQSLDQGLNPAVQGYLQDTVERAKDALSESIYWFVKSYQYELLKDVEDSFYDFDSWTEKLQAQELAKLTAKPQPPNQPSPTSPLAQRDPKILLSKEDFEKVGIEVFKAETFKLGHQLLDTRQTRAENFEGKYQSCVLARSTAAEEAWKNEMLDSLLENGEISFSFVDHFNKGNYSLYDARVIDVELREFRIDTNDPDLSLTLRVQHAGRSVIRRKTDGAYCAFESGRNDDPVSWQWIYNQPPKGKEKESGVSKSKRQDTIGANIRGLLDKALPEFKEYSPGLFSDYLFRIHDWDARKRDAIKAINSIVMDVTIAQA